MIGFQIIGQIGEIESIAASGSIREISRLRRIYGQGRWRKLKGVATVMLSDSTICIAELHWYEADGIGRREIKLKYILE